MNRILPMAVGAVLAVAAYAQPRSVPNTYGSVTGFGSVLYPGVGHAPTLAYPGFASPTFASRLGATVRGGNVAPRISHPSHGNRIIVPYPVFLNGYGGGYYDSPAPYNQEPMPQVSQPGGTPPVVIINQGYRPETAQPVMRDYADAQLPEPGLQTYQAPIHAPPDPRDRAARVAESERPTLYLIAFKDHTILPALAYWVEGDTLNYVTQQGTPNRASMTLIDRDFSRQLNRERSVEFNLP
jgi:hypothetical protein